MANPFQSLGIIPSTVPIKPNTQVFEVLNARPASQTSSPSAPTSAPPKADAAPKPSNTTVGTGLVAALNNFQLTLLNNKGADGKPKPLIQIPDEYEIVFADSIIANASIVPPAGLDKALAVGSTGGTAADRLLPNKQSMDPTSRARAAAAGQQIVQFIDQVIRSSTYIQNQSDQVFNQSTGQYEKGNQKPADQFAWFQVLCNVAILDYDYIRKDFAYKMTFTIVPFETPMLSSFFPSGKYRGVHKAYNYWFTGENNSILSFEQSLNNQWTQAITGGTAPDPRVARFQNNINAGYMNAWRSQVFPASGQSNQGGDKNTNEPGANAADFLYSSDLASVKINIVGDPAWLPSPLSDYVTPELFTTRPFFADGTINSVASGAYFSVAFNTPADYNLQTGLIDPDTAPTGSRIRTQETVYVASRCISTFRGGKFTQELAGQWVTYNANPEVISAATAREVKTKTVQSRLPPFDSGSGPNTGWNAWGATIGQAQTSLAKGVNQILNPVTQSDAPSLTQLQGSVAYTTARRQGATPEQALAIAKQAFANGTAGQPTPPQKIIKDGNPG
jgi:hypothetical protein